eukprot:TRINITY_DN86808_c0_g1_i1.p3 TRINITY_DN86808_c0_g1~~TRINITY_DN86808_c0_g1_i1.p3  ORF type:complete len:102 (-),score=6.88 TRINITY_DN86808_c0_g1_i1:1-306(-)
MSFGGQTLLGHDDQNSQCLHICKAPPRFDAAQYSFFTDANDSGGLLEGGIEDEVEEPKCQKREEEDHTWDQYQHEISVRLDQLTMRGNQPIKPLHLQNLDF